MRTQRSFIFLSIFCILISGKVILMSTNGTNWSNISIGLFSSSILMLATSTLSYITERNNMIRKFIENIKGMQKSLSEFYIGDDISQIRNNSYLLNECMEFFDGDIHLCYQDVSFIFLNGLKAYMKNDVMDNLSSVYSKISTDYGMLRQYLIYEVDDEDAYIHYVKSVSLSKINNSEVSHMEIDTYSGLKRSEKIEYHNNSIAQVLLSSNVKLEQSHQKVVHALPEITIKLTALWLASATLIVTRKRILKYEGSINSSGEKWDKVSSEMDERIKKTIVKSS